MTEGFVYWRNMSGVTEVPVLFVPKSELPLWSLTALLSKVVHNREHLKAACHSVVLMRDITHTMRIFEGREQQEHLLVPQLDLEEVLDHLVETQKLAKKGAAAILSFLQEVPTPSPPPKGIRRRHPSSEEKEERRLKKGKQEEGEESSSSSVADEGEPYWQPQEQEEQEEDEQEEQEDEEAAPLVVAPEGVLDHSDRHLIDQVMVATRLLDTMRHLVNAPLIDQSKPAARPSFGSSTSSSPPLAGVFKTFREREDAILFMRNVYRSLPQKNIMGFLTEECGDEEDDSQVVTVGQRATQLGYTVPEAGTYAGRTLRMEIGLLATKYYRELYEGRDPPQLYRVMHGGQRQLVNKWTLNNCGDTLDRAIHTIMQGHARESS